jgi:branched-chain amino acid transport system substrate-binding protein
MNRKITIGLLAILIFGAIGTMQVNTVSADPVDVTLGLLTPLTGDLGSLGETFQNAFKMAIADLNDMQDDYNFLEIIEDTKTDSTATVTATTNLIADGVSGIIGAAASGNTLAAIEIAKNEKIPMISYASTSPAITTVEDDDFLFRVVPTDEIQGIAAALLAYELGFTKIAIIALNNAYGQGLVGVFKESFENGTHTVVVEQSYAETLTDFTTIVTAVDNSEADGILLVSYNNDGVLILNELENQNVNIPIIGTDGVKSPTLFEANYYIGMYGTAPLVDIDEEWGTRYNETYGAAPTIFVPETYDATMIMGKAVIAAGSTTGEDIRDQLRGIANGYEGVSGTITFDENGDQVGTAFEFWQATADNEFIRVGQYSEGEATFTGEIIPVTPFAPASFAYLAVFLALGTFAIVMTFRRKLK